MKKRVLFYSAVVAMVAMSACARQEVMTPADSTDAVKFGVYTAQTTRGKLADTESLKASQNGFGVWGFYTKQAEWLTAVNDSKPNFMWNQQVTFANGDWTYTPLKYWPNTLNDKISYFAYAPFNGQGTGGHETPEDCQRFLLDNTLNPTGIDLKPNYLTGWPNMYFAIDPSPAAMEDLLFADNLTDQLKRTDAMKFELKHALTRVNLVARLDKELTNIVDTYGKTYVFITDVKIVGTGACERYPEGATAAGNADSRFFQTGTLVYGKSVADGVPAEELTRWDYAPTRTAVDDIKTTDVTALFAKPYIAPYELADILALSANDIVPNQPMSLKVKSASEFTGDAAADPVTPLFKENEYLFLIPPYNYEGIKSEKDIILQVGYDIVTIDENLEAGWSITHTDARISLPNGTLKMGTAYRYTLTIGLEDVKVNAAVTDWGTEEKYYAPSTEVTVASDGVAAISIIQALERLGEAKDVNPDCNYFVLNVNQQVVAHLVLNKNVAPYMYADRINALPFKSGDIVEVNYLGGCKNNVSSSTINVYTNNTTDTGTVPWMVTKENPLSNTTVWNQAVKLSNDTSEKVTFFLRRD